ncbi:MAG: peptidase M28, partial [Ginsengibacter sp.]
MRQFLKNVSLFVLVIFMQSCSENSKSTDGNDQVTFSADSIKQNIAILASDSFMGRKPFTAGETKTLDFLQAKYKEIGLEPGNGNSYLQAVPMVNIEATADSQ